MSLKMLISFFFKVLNNLKSLKISIFGLEIWERGEKLEDLICILAAMFW